MEIFEVANPSFRDIPLDQQIEFGINDWCVRTKSGHEYFGESKAKAIANASAYSNQ